MVDLPNPTVTADETPQEDDFSAAFASLTAPEDNPEATVTVTPPETPAVPPVQSETPTTPVVDDQTTFIDPEAALNPATQTPEAPKPPALTLDDSFIDKFAQAMQKSQPRPPAPAQTAPVQQTPPALYNQQEAAFLTEYQKDYPDVAQAQALQMRANNQVLLNHVFQEVHKAYKPYMDQLEALLEDRHMANLKTTVPDYDDSLVDKVSSWVETQPAYLKAAYTHVMERGTQDEVADLVSRFRAANPASAQQQTATTPAKPALPPAAKKAAAALAPVSGKRSAIVTDGIDPNDFGSAFERYAKQN
jgi:hypothetical protein